MIFSYLWQNPCIFDGAFKMDASVNNLIPAVYAFLPRRDLSIWRLGSHEMKNFEFLTFTDCICPYKADACLATSVNKQLSFK